MEVTIFSADEPLVSEIVLSRVVGALTVTDVCSVACTRLPPAGYG